MERTGGATQLSACKCKCCRDLYSFVELQKPKGEIYMQDLNIFQLLHMVLVDAQYKGLKVPFDSQDSWNAWIGEILVECLLRSYRIRKSQEFVIKVFATGKKTKKLYPSK